MKDLLIVVPYRIENNVNRKEQLIKYIETTPKFFNDRNITFDILISELDNEGDWNIGLCINSVVKFANKNDYKYLYINDVDVFPINGKWSWPKENEIINNLGDYGSCLLKYEYFLKAGGYSNNMWNWGHSDEFFYKKLLDNQYYITLNVLEDKTLEFYLDFQNHERITHHDSTSKNISSIKRSHTSSYDDIEDSIKGFDIFAKVHSLTNLMGNVYKHNIKPLKNSSYEYKLRNKKLI